MYHSNKVNNKHLLLKLVGFILLITGKFLSITYFIVIPYIPEKKLIIIVVPISIAVLAFSPTFNKEITNPIASPAKAPTKVIRITNGKLEPKSAFNTNIV